MGELIGGLVEGALSGIKAITRDSVANALEKLAGDVRRGDIVSDEALSRANKTLQRMRSVRAQYQEG